MRVLLTIPYSDNDIRNSLGFVSPPLGLGYVASYLREFGSHEVLIHDGMLHQTTDDEFADLVSDYRPDIVGISAQATPAIYDVYRFAAVVKDCDPDCNVVVGGAHASFSDDLILRDAPQIDFVVRGEGERVMLELLERIGADQFDKVKGITYRSKSNMQRNPSPPPIGDLDALPFPAYDLMEMNQYLQGPIRVGTMISSRGCPYKCTFCSSSRSSGKKWRGRSAENVVEEIELLVKNYKINELEFLDDLFCYDPMRVKQICDLMRARNISLNWTCSVRADILSNNPLMAKGLREAGCRSVYIGVESGKQRVLDLMRKGITLQQVWRSNEIAKRAKLERIFSFVLGYPGETQEEAMSTILMACRLNPEIAQFTICTPYPGTPLFEHAKKEGLLKAKSWRDYSVLAPVMELTTISKKKLKEILYQAYFRFYLRPSVIWRQIKSKNIFFLGKILEGIRAYIRKRSRLAGQEPTLTHESSKCKDSYGITERPQGDCLTITAETDTTVRGLSFENDCEGKITSG
ncbi:MAG: B12-binding domain-containing radical SAM protein [Candidatus Thorarchaeota archaeon]